jgi:predicted lipid-binding transport protein (Tim44 family)
VNVFPIQTPPEGDGAKCPNCGAAIVADQRYCLACGQPCSPVRLAFLDVLQAESELRAPTTIVAPPAGYLPPLPHDDGAIGRLRRYSGLFGLIAVLLMTGLIGLLVGHWLAPSKAPAASVIKIEGGLPSAGVASTTTTPTTPSSPSSTSSGKAAASKSAAATEAQEVKEVKEAESPKATPKPAVKPSAATLNKLSSSKGKQHEKEIEKLTEGKKPIETGG